MSENLFDGLSILLVEDDAGVSEQINWHLTSRGCKITQCESFDGAVKACSSQEAKFDLAIIDMYIPATDNQKPDHIMRGEELGYRIKEISPSTKVIGISAHIDRQPFTSYSELFSGFIFKRDMPYGKQPIILLETIEGIVASEGLNTPRIFIVHGHDEGALLALKNYIQNRLRLGVPIVLRERPSLGKTVIEKFEDEATNVDIVFVILSPDDDGVRLTRGDIRRARPNVIFELGFFFAKLQRRSGRIFLLTKGVVELPSDISGIVYIDITNGIESAGESIRRELEALNWIKQ